MVDSDHKTNQIVLITGLSGAGRSTVLRTLEDLGYESIDNLPLSLLSPLLLQRNLDASKMGRALAIGIDVRSHSFTAIRFQENLSTLRREGLDIKVLYLDCSSEFLIRRYSESRRRHPVQGISLLESIEKERTIISPLQDIANLVLDTSQLSTPSLRQYIEHHLPKGENQEIMLSVFSFSYREGLPQTADIVFDARFLDNPYYEKKLQELSGLDEPVRNFLESQAIWQETFPSLKTIIQNSIKGFLRLGRSYLGIACGCTGGQHRSVFMAMQITEWLEKQGVSTLTIHKSLSSQQKGKTSTIRRMI